MDASVAQKERRCLGNQKAQERSLKETLSTRNRGERIKAVLIQNEKAGGGDVGVWGCGGHDRNNFLNFRNV